MKRPSNKELFGKLRGAKKAVQGRSIFLLDQDVIAEDAIELGYDIGSELFQVFTELLEETSLDHYAGSRPPKKSYNRKSKVWSFFHLWSKAAVSSAEYIISLLSVKDRFGQSLCIKTGQWRSYHESVKLPQGPWPHGA